MKYYLNEVNMNGTVEKEMHSLALPNLCHLKGNAFYLAHDIFVSF
jgi:hypothetical protein